MGLTLESFRTGIQGAPVDVTGTGTAKKGFLVYSETEKGGLKLELKDLKPQSGGEYNGLIRSQLLKALRDSLSASNHSGEAVDNFMAKAEAELFGPLDGDGGDGTIKAFQNLECATVQKLLEEFDTKFGSKSNEADIAQIKRNLRPGSKNSVPKSTMPKTSVPKKSALMKSGGTGSIGTTGSQKAPGVGKPEIDIGEWVVLDLPQDQLTTVQRELRANCPDATPRQRSAVRKLDAEFPYKDLGIGRSVAKGLKVSSVRPSEIEGFIECSLEGPNGKADVLIDQAGVCTRKGLLTKKQVEADYQAFAELLAEARVSNSVGGYLDVAKSFAHSELKIATDLVSALKDVDDGGVVDNFVIVGVLLNKLLPALRQLPHALTSAGAREKNIVACWNLLKLPEPAPRAGDPALPAKFFRGLKQVLFNDYMKALNRGPNIQADPSIMDDFQLHFMNPEDSEGGDAEFMQKVETARNKIGWYGAQALLKDVMNYITTAGTVTGLSYDARLKCINDPHYVPRPHDFFSLPKLDYPVNGDVKDTLANLNGSIGGADGRYHNVKFTLDDGKQVSCVWPGLDHVEKGDVPKRLGEFQDKLLKSFNKEQVIQLAHYLNDSALFVTGMGMSSSDQNAGGTMSITKDKNGDMKVEFKRPSRRLSGIDKTCGTITYQSCETTDDCVHRFTIGSDGIGKTDSITLEKNANRKTDVSLFNDRRVTEGQLKFLDYMDKDPAKALGIDKSKADGLTLIFLGNPNSEGVSTYTFRKQDDDGKMLLMVDVEVDADGLILGKPKITEGKV